jgi:hydroxypyruvate reductase
MHDPFSLLQHLWGTGVDSVSGRHAVTRALKQDGPFSASLVIAVGKAACSMFLGAGPCISPATRSVVVSKYGHIDAACRASVTGAIIESAHPVPDANSLSAGEAVIQAVSRAGSQDRLLLLVSGGASALVEALQPGFGLTDLQSVTRRLLSSGQSIAEINEVRSGMSRIKGGRLLGEFRGDEARVYAVSDVQGDALATIGGGIGDPCHASATVEARIVASNRVARDAAAAEAERLGFPVMLNKESLYKDVMTVAGEISRQLAGASAGVYIWGGEPTIELPPHPGSGGRNQSLALAVAGLIKGSSGISVLVAGTDGTDGPTDYAGAYVDGKTVDDAEDAEDALRRADAGIFLGRRKCLFKSGPTNTNVMDLVIAKVD